MSSGQTRQSAEGHLVRSAVSSRWENMRMRARTRTTKPPSRRYWIEVIELVDTALPRRHPDKENLRVSITQVKPGPDLDSRWNNKRRREPGVFGEIRDDLMPKRSVATPEQARCRRRETIDRLQARGYTVNGNLMVWSVYVIELDSSHLPGCPGYFYVGQTSKTPEERIEEHRLGKRKASGDRLFGREAHRYFKCRREDLEPKRKWFSSPAALKAESHLRRKLEARGYTVAGGTECSTTNNRTCRRLG